jgi:hypothetical protein
MHQHCRVVLRTWHYCRVYQVLVHSLNPLIYTCIVYQSYKYANLFHYKITKYNNLLNNIFNLIVLHSFHNQSKHCSMFPIKEFTKTMKCNTHKLCTFVTRNTQHTANIVLNTLASGTEVECPTEVTQQHPLLISFQDPGIQSK